jgi:hypothetical protein
LKRLRLIIIIIKAIEKTIKRKILRKKKKKNVSLELKGVKTDINVKKYFYNLIKNSKFDILTLN